MFAPEPNIVLLQRLTRRSFAEAVKVAGAASVAAVLVACTPHGDAGESIRIDDPEATQVTPTSDRPDPAREVVEPETEQVCEPEWRRPRRLGLRVGDVPNPLG